MLTRIALMFVVFTTLCAASFTLGGISSERRQDASGIPAGHPILLALHNRAELGLNDVQVEKLNSLRDALGKEFAPYREQAETIQHRMQDLQQSGKQDPDEAKKLQQASGELSDQIHPLFERYAHEVGDLLTHDQKEQLMKISNATEHSADAQEFELNTIIQSRDSLGITPQQFTKLQYLQADFIRAFAPVREKMEVLQMEVQEKFAKVGKSPTPDYTQRGAELQKQVAALKVRFSDQAVKDVLDPKQRTTLEDIWHGEHRSAPNEG